MASHPSKIGRYEVIKAIGEGGMGSVFLAKDPVIDRLVAVKVLRSELSEEELRERFYREAQSAGRLSHPNIVTIYDVGVDESDRPYIAMEYVEGRSLASIISQREARPIGEKLDVLTQICEGLAYAHRLGVIHRDIKPANLILNPNGVIKILDFGIARIGSSSMTAEGVLIGTLSYMSPEQVTGAPVDHRADIFAVGALAYELLSYSKAFEGGIQNVLFRILNAPPTPLRSLVPDLDQRVVDIVNRALEKKPGDRYQDLDAMSRELAAVRANLAGNAKALPILLPVDEPGEPNRAPGTRAEDTGTSLSTVYVPREEVLAANEEEGTGSSPEGTVVLQVPLGALNPATGLPDVRLRVAGTPSLALSGKPDIPITASPFTIGRHPTCDLVLSDPACSRQHASIEFVDGRFEISDLGSENGTHVSGRPVKSGARKPLHFGAEIEIGHSTLTFLYGRETRLPDLSGCSLAGRYRLLRPLRPPSDKAAVYEAEDSSPVRKVAIKLLSPALLDFAGYRELFTREEEMARRLEHPHICKVLQSGEARLLPAGGGPIVTYYLCFPLLEGGSLADRLDRGPLPSLAESSRWIGHIAEALEHAHQEHVIHGDLKPSAILFDAHQNVYLTDFSAAHRPEQRGGLLLGHPDYMAPEFWEDVQLTQAADQYGLAAIAYYMVTGSVPLRGQRDPEDRERNFTFGPPPAHVEAGRKGRKDVPRAVSRVLKRALARRAEDRYPSIAEFAKAFSASVRGLDVVDHPRVFISYERETAGGWAHTFSARLRSEHKFDVFVDTERSDGVGLFSERIRRKINDCDVFACFLSATSLKAAWVRKEVALAHEFGKPMVPIILDSYRKAQEREKERRRRQGGSLAHVDLETDPAVLELLASEGVPLFDHTGDFVEASIDKLASYVRERLARKDEPE